MKSKKSYTLISLLMVILMLCGCARTDETIDVNYWRYKLKKPSSSSLLENAQNATQNAINKGADATEDLYDMVGGKIAKENGDFFANLAGSFADQIKQWGQEGFDNANERGDILDQTSSKDEVSVTETTIVADAAASLNGRIEVTLDRVVDGDTFMVIYKGSLLRVRLIGINTPESVHTDASQNTPEGKEASNYVKELLKDVTTLWLEFDQDPEDDYGRTLAYAWLNEAGTNIESDLLNGVILKSGHAEIMNIEPNSKYANDLANIK